MLWTGDHPRKPLGECEKEKERPKGSLITALRVTSMRFFFKTSSFFNVDHL